MIMQLDPKGKKLKELDICFQMFISLVWSIDFTYKKKHVIYSNIHQKLLPKQQMQEWKLELPKAMARKFFWLLQILTWWQNNFKNTSTAIRTM